MPQFPLDSLTVNKLQKFLPTNKEVIAWHTELTQQFPQYMIVTYSRIASFLAQTIHESAGYNRLSENLNYSVEGLLKTFPKYFNLSLAKQYARQPERIANRVYANRMGNGPEESGDGWKYRGRGLIQLTGKDNYRNFYTHTLNTLNFEDWNPSEVATQKELTVQSALWFWKKAQLNDFADKNDIKGMTKRINGGYNGLEERIHLFNNILRQLTN